MIESRVHVDGLEQLRLALQNIRPAVQAALDDVAHTMRSLALGRTPVGIRKGHSGTLKRSWGRVERASGGYSFGNVAPYAHVLEEGLYPGLGPRTTLTSGGGMARGFGIYSKQAPGGILSPLLDDESVLQRVADLVANEIVRGINRVART